MTQLSTTQRRLTPEEYLRLEADSVDKHEYFDGQIIGMAGGTEAHSLIITNLIGELRQRLKGKPCRVYESNLKVHVPRTPTYVYPDLSIICGETQFDPNDRNRATVTNPSVIVEVLSPSTEAYDRGRKLRRYLQLDSLRECVLVAQDTAAVESYFRRGDGEWLFTPASGLETEIRLHALGVQLPLSEIYAGVELAPDSDEPSAR